MRERVCVCMQVNKITFKSGFIAMFHARVEAYQILLGVETYIQYIGIN